MRGSGSSSCLKEYADDWDIEDLVDNIERVYTSTPESNRDLRDPFLRATTLHRTTIIRDTIFRPKYRDIWARVPQYALDVTLHLLKIDESGESDESSGKMPQYTPYETLRLLKFEEW